MANHPNRSQQQVDAALRRLISKHSLARIDATFSRDGVSLRAFPDGFHPIVAQRRDAAFAEKSDWSIGEARDVHEMAMAEVAHVWAKTMDEAVQGMAAKLG